MELSEHHQKLTSLGIKVAVITYEPPGITIQFSDKWQIPYPILHDNEARLVKAFGVLNPEYGPDHDAYGLPLPGILLVDPMGVVKAKYSMPAYQDRPEWEQIFKDLDSEGNESAAPVETDDSTNT